MRGRRSRCVVAALGVGLILDAAALQGIVLGEPLGEVANALFLPRLRRAVLWYTSVLYAVGGLCILSVFLIGCRSLLFLAAVAVALVAAASVVLAYAVHSGTGRLGPELQETCRLLRERGDAPWADMGTVDQTLREFAVGLARCRAGRPEARTLDDCLELRAMWTSAEQVLSMELERALEERLGCAGLCHRLGAPLFSEGSRRREALGPVTDRAPPQECWRDVAAVFADSGVVLILWLGVTAPVLLGAAVAVLQQQVLHPTTPQYQRIPNVAPEEASEGPPCGEETEDN